MLKTFLITALVVTVGAVVLLLIAPWSDSGNVATGQSRSIAVCDIAVDWPANSKIIPSPWDGEELARQIRDHSPNLEMDGDGALADKLTGKSNVIALIKGHGVNTAPAVYLDAETGQRIVGFGNANERAEIQATVHNVRKLTVADKSWPYHDVGPVVSNSGKGKRLHWREPDQMSGLQALPGFALAGPAELGGSGSGEIVTLQGCHSTRKLLAYYDRMPEGAPGCDAVKKICIPPDQDLVTPEDKSAFDAFFTTVTFEPDEAASTVTP